MEYTLFRAVDVELDMSRGWEPELIDEIVQPESQDRLAV
jgi:hypothetical protein